jgi:hypothetical protein
VCVVEVCCVWLMWTFTAACACHFQRVTSAPDAKFRQCSLHCSACFLYAENHAMLVVRMVSEPTAASYVAAK